MIDLYESGALATLADQWLTFQRETFPDGRVLTGRDLVTRALDDLLRPIPDKPSVTGYDITLEVETGNLISAHFDDWEALQEFLHLHRTDPRAILDKITPKPAPKP
jgi:hypothetical protein